MCILLLSDFLFMGKMCIWYTFVLKKTKRWQNDIKGYGKNTER